MCNRIKELREERELSLRDLGLLIDIKYNTISSWETGIRDMSTKIIKQLSSFFEVSTDYLLNYDGFCLYLTYENSKTVYRIDDKDYQLLKDYIYFNNEAKRCIDINKYVGCAKEVNCGEVLNEISLHLKLEKLFDKKATINQFNDIINDKDRVILTVGLLDALKAAIND